MILTVTLNAAIDKRYVVDNFQVGQVNRVKECTYVPGGKGLNVSKPASIYGADVVATGFVGGHAGAYIEDALKPFGIKGAFYHVDAESRSCINIWDEINHIQTEFLESGFTLTEEDFKGFEAKFRELVKEAKVVTTSDFPVKTGTRSNINLAAQNGIDSGSSCSTVKINDSVHNAMVCNGCTVHPQLLHTGHVLFYFVGTVQQTVFCVDMKVRKCHLFFSFLFYVNLCCDKQSLLKNFVSKI